MNGFGQLGVVMNTEMARIILLILKEQKKLIDKFLNQFSFGHFFANMLDGQEVIITDPCFGLHPIPDSLGITF
jgi:hypothetical protein